MTVRSMIQVVSDQMAESLAERVPEDVEVVYDVATVMMPNLCEDGHMHGVKPMVRLGIYADFSDEKVHRAPVNISVVIPHWYVQDGDTSPVEEAVEVLWSDAIFANLMEPLAPLLHGVAEEMGAEEVEVDDDDTE